MKLHVATSRPVGERCFSWAKMHGFQMVPMRDCEIFVSVMYDRIVQEDFIAGRKCFNFHPGILPEYRGAGAYSWAILNGERETGVTLHEIDRDIDHGPIIEVRKFPVMPDSTASSLFRQAEKVMVLMFRHWLPKLIAGEYATAPQDEANAGIYYRKELERAKNITRIVRAFHFPGKESAYYFNSEGKKTYIEL